MKTEDDIRVEDTEEWQEEARRILMEDMGLPEDEAEMMVEDYVDGFL